MLPRLRQPSGRPSLPPHTVTVIVGAVALASAGAVTIGVRVLPAVGALVLAGLLVRHRMALLTAFLYIGIFKDNGLLENLPIDPTLFLGVLLAGVCLYRLLNGYARMPPPAFLFLLVVVGFLLVVSLRWTPAMAYGDQKAAKWWTLTMLSALSPFFIVEDRDDLRRFAGWTAVAAIIAGLGVLAHPPTQHPGQQGRLVLASLSGTIFLARLLLAGALALLYAAVFAPGQRWRLAAGVLGVGLVILSAGVGSRGPLVAFALSLVCVTVISIVNEPRRLVSLLVVVAVSVAVFPYISLPETSVARLSNLVTNPSGSLAQDARHAIYHQAIEIIKAHPLRGIGSGGYSTYASVVSQSGFTEKYPHNIFLEMWVELGILPVILLAASVLYVAAGFVRRRQGDDLGRHLTNLYLGLFLINLFSVQFSGDMNDNRTFWTAMGVGWLLHRYDLAWQDASPQPSVRAGPIPSLA